MALAPQGKYSPVMPIRLFQSLLEYQDKHQDEDVVGDYFLLLAHDILAHPEVYRGIFQKRTHIPKDSFVILDNSVIELGKPLDVEFLLHAAEIVNPNCIILPDVLGDMQQSAALVRKAHNGILADPNTPDDIQMMAVLQGRNIAELTRCATQYADSERVTYFGAPRWVANQLGTRRVFETVLGIHHEVQTPNVHMLGMSRNIYDDIECTQLPGVMGIDSANPIVLGQQGIPLQMDDYQHASRNQGTFDYWQETEVTPTTINNILTMRRLVDGRRKGV